MSAILIAVFAEYWPAILGGLALVAAALGIRLKGKSDGRQEVQAQINKQAVEAAKGVRDVQTKINRMPDNAAAAELNRKWVRDKGTGGR